jgi:DNA polymerase-3 subunit delta'
MQEPAANAILKTLEEPAGASLFVLVTAVPSALLPTVLSRCQGVRFDPLGQETLRDILVRHGRTPEEAAAAAALAGGSAERALALDVEETRADSDRIIQAAWGGLGSLVSVLERAEDLARDRARLEAALEVLASFTRDLAVAKVGGAAAFLVHTDRRAEAFRLAAGCSMRAILAIHEAQAEGLRALARNASPRFTAERVLLRMRQAVREGEEDSHVSRGAN